MRVEIQPARLATRLIHDHYRNTIRRPVAFDDHADLLGPELVAELRRQCQTGSTPMWGNTPATRADEKSRAIRQMSPGDYVFFSGDKQLYFGGTVAATWQNAELAHRLWGGNDGGGTWEHMYALVETRGFKTPMDEVRATIGRKLPDPLRSLTILDEADSAALLELLSLEPAPVPAGPPHRPGGGTYTSDLERVMQGLARGEQKPLRDRLLPGPIGECALCGRQFPRELLVAAHIKKRAKCTDDEKRDLDNIAMLACTLGCDALYERGYVCVDEDGNIQVSPLAADIPDIAKHITGTLADRVVSWSTETRSPYFHWHRTHTFKESPPA